MRRNRQLIKSIALLCICQGGYANTSYELNESLFSPLAIEVGYGLSTHSGNSIRGDKNLNNHLFEINEHQYTDYLFGLHYFVPFSRDEYYAYYYGISANYIKEDKLEGDITNTATQSGQKFEFDERHIPVYFNFRAELMNFVSNQINSIIDVGLGVDIVNARNFKLTNSNGGAINDNTFTARSHRKFTAELGFGLRFTNVFDHNPLELEYKYMMLGESMFKGNRQYTTIDFHTGRTGFHALTFALALG